MSNVSASMSSLASSRRPNDTSERTIGPSSLDGIMMPRGMASTIINELSKKQDTNHRSNHPSESLSTSKGSSDCSPTSENPFLQDLLSSDYLASLHDDIQQSFQQHPANARAVPFADTCLSMSRRDGPPPTPTPQELTSLLFPPMVTTNPYLALAASIKIPKPSTPPQPQQLSHDTESFAAPSLRAPLPNTYTPAVSQTALLPPSVRHPMPLPLPPVMRACRPPPHFDHIKCRLRFIDQDKLTQNQKKDPQLSQSNSFDRQGSVLPPDEALAGGFSRDTVAAQIEPPVVVLADDHTNNVSKHQRSLHIAKKLEIGRLSVDKLDSSLKSPWDGDVDISDDLQARAARAQARRREVRRKRVLHAGNGLSNSIGNARRKISGNDVGKNNIPEEEDVCSDMSSSSDSDVNPEDARQRLHQAMHHATMLKYQRSRTDGDGAPAIDHAVVRQTPSVRIGTATHAVAHSVADLHLSETKQQYTASDSLLSATHSLPSDAPPIPISQRQWPRARVGTRTTMSATPAPDYAHKHIFNPPSTPEPVKTAPVRSVVDYTATLPLPAHGPGTWDPYNFNSRGMMKREVLTESDRNRGPGMYETEKARASLEGHVPNGWSGTAGTGTGFRALAHDFDSGFGNHANPAHNKVRLTRNVSLHTFFLNIQRYVVFLSLSLFEFSLFSK